MRRDRAAWTGLWAKIQRRLAPRIGHQTGVPIDQRSAEEQLFGCQPGPSGGCQAKGFSGRKFSQREDELARLIDILRAEGATSYLEIGARDGDSFHAIMSSLPMGSRGVAVDLPEALWGRESSRLYLERAIADLRRKGYDVRVFFGDSRATDIVDRVRGHAPFDALLIDGDHTLAGVTKDWENYGPMSRIVAFHDIEGNSHRTATGEYIQVPKLWALLKQKFQFVEINGERPGMGIGILWR